MKVTRKQAIKAFDYLTDGRGDWVEDMDSVGLYNEDKDEWATFEDLLYALGVSRQEIDELNLNN